MKTLLKKIICRAIPVKVFRLFYKLNSFIIDKQTKRFIEHSKRVWKDWRIKNCESEILVDFYSVSQTLIAYSYFLNVLAKKYNACIKTFSSRSPYDNPALYKVYQSFNTSGYVVPILNQEQEIRKKKISQKIKQNIKTKKDVFEIRALGVWIGIDIYESYLRAGNPTLDLNDPKLHDLISEACGLLVFWREYLDRNKIAAIVVSHDCYINLNILCKLAYQNKVPVYLPNVRGMQFSDEPHAIYKSRFWNYRSMFKKLLSAEQTDAIQWAKGQLERRLNGEVGVDMHYSTASAFTSIDNEKPVLRKSDKIKVLICTHCFYDNPHGYGGMLFLDFYEWLCFLGEISEKTDYDWYVKTHPDYLPGTLETLNEIIRKYPKLSLIPSDTSHHQLAKEGISFALTCYGSIGHELPALGVQVINTGYNPHVAYDFNWHPRSIEEYEYYLMNLDKLHKEINMNELYEFYYVHYNYTYVDSLIYTSHRKMLKDLTLEEQIGPKAYEHFLNQLTESKYQEIIDNIQKFVDSGKRNYFSRGPE